MTVAVELSAVSVTYRQATGGLVHALDGVNLRCARGSSTAIVGRSGSGKSTLISVMALLRQPTSGQVRIGGEEPATMSRRQQAVTRSSKVGVVFQSFHLESSLSVIDNVLLGWHFWRNGLSRSQALARVLQDLELLGIGDLAAQRPNSLSGGQRQRVAVARAIFARPPLLVADEPTGSLDEETAGSVAQLLYDLPRELGTAVIVVTHDLAVASMAESRLELQRGRICDAER